MVLATGCQTPGAEYTIKIHDTSVEVKVNLNITLNLDEKAAESLEVRLHNAIEQVLAQHYIH